MSNNDDNNDKPSAKDDYLKQLNNMLKEWPVMDTLDFEGVTADVTKWEDDTYTVTLNFYWPNESGEPPHSGFSLCTQIGGESLEEVHHKLTHLMIAGLFDGIAVGAVGTIFDHEANEIGEVDWTNYDEDDDEDDDDNEDENGSDVSGDDGSDSDGGRVLH